MRNLPSPITPAEAKRVWEHLPRPSARRVATALRQAGRGGIHFTTINRWRAQKWKPVQHDPHPIEAARLALDVAAPVLTGNATGGIEAFLEGRNHSKNFDGVIDRELLRCAARKTLIAVNLLCEGLEDRMAELMEENIRGVAALLAAIGTAGTAATYGLVQAESMQANTETARQSDPGSRAEEGCPAGLSAGHERAWQAGRGA